MFLRIVCVLAVGGTAAIALAGAESIGVQGIDAVGLVDFNGDPLTGQFVDIGQVETARTGIAGYDTDTDCCEPSTVPDEVYHLDHVAAQNETLALTFHAMWVAGAMISTDTDARGVATDARLQASAYSSTTLS